MSEREDPYSGSAKVESFSHAFPAIDVSTFYADCFPTVRKYVMENSGTEADAEDVFQEAMAILWLKCSKGDIRAGSDSNLGGYVFRIAKFKWLDQVRSARNRTTSGVELDENTAELQEAGELEERIAFLQSLYGQLDEKCQHVLDMFYYEKKDLRTIAAAIGVDESSVRTIKYRCMMKLRKFNARSLNDHDT